MFDFDRPFFLLLIPAALLFPWLGGRYSLARWSARKPRCARACALLILTLLCLALAGPRLLTKTNEPPWFSFVTFRRAWNPAAESKRFAEPWRQTNPNASRRCEFAREPLVVKGFGLPRSDRRLPRSGEEATDLSAALEFAATLMPADRPSRIVLFSDGVAHHRP